ncbi:MAG: FKBP-type peptidyl-prolyl cis-trans isomerase [Marinifilaceae bacterium]
MKYTEEIDKVSYCLGLSIASNLLTSGVKSINVEAFTSALDDAFAGKEPTVTPEEANQTLQAFFGKIQEQMSAAAVSVGKEFLTANANAEGVITLESGLQYKVLTAGNGKIPTETDQVKCHYEGKLINGAIFDSSYKRNEPATFPVNGVIKGWVEALQLMETGAKWQLFVPSELAYGAQGAGQAIGPNETLIFDVELLEIV